MSESPLNSPQDLAEPVTETDHALGPPNAPVTLVEYGDYECPDCINAQPIVMALRKYFGDRLRIVFRHFPQSSIHPGASAAARAAEAAAAQGLFWQMHEELFRLHHEIADVDLTHLALRLNAELYRFERDRESPKLEHRILADLDSGARSGVRGTPTFFINGSRYRGPAEKAALAAAIRAAESKARR